MDLGIRGKTAIVCAASKGLGRGCAEALAEAGVDLVINARNAHELERVADDISAKYNVGVTPVAADITTEEGRRLVLSSLPEPDILVTNAGGPPPGIWSDWKREDFIRAIDGNMLTPISLMKAVLPKMIDKKWGRIVNITSQSVKSPIAALGLSNTARAGLTGYVAGTSRQVAPHGVCINNMLPGIHGTDRAASLDKGIASSQGISIEEAYKQRVATIPARRYGSPDEFGQMCAFLCSQHSGFIIGQNILLDGGQVNATL